MQEREQLQDIAHVKTITPYRQLRELRGLSQEKAAEVFDVSRRTIFDVENCKRDASKQLVLRMDDYYGCKGALVAYWLPKFSARAPAPENGRKKSPEASGKASRRL